MNLSHYRTTGGNMNTLKLNNELARPIGIVDGTRPGGANKRPRSHCKALTDCRVTRADGSTYTIAANAPRTKAPKQDKVRGTVVRDYTSGRIALDRSLMARMGNAA